MTDEDERLAAAKERAWRSVAALDEAHLRGEIDDDGWHRGMAGLIVPAYLAGDERGGSGHSGSAEDWEWSRGVVGEAVDRGGSFLDVGCANGLLMASVARWAGERGLAVEPYGLEISEALAEVARGRLPMWRDRIFVGNALGWIPPRRFDTVRTGLEYVPPGRRRELVAWLLDEVVAPGGRLIVGKYNEEVEAHATEAALRRWGFNVAGRVERAHRSEPRLAYRAVSIAAPRADELLKFRALRREDVPLLRRWLNEPHVDRWWRTPLDEAATAAEYVPRIDGREPTHVFVIVLDGRPIGWIQWFRWADYPEHAAQLGAEATAAGLDLAIGEADLLGRGIGTRALRRFVEDVVFADPAISACVCDPEVENARSLRAFARAGFSMTKRVRRMGEAVDRLVAFSPPPRRPQG